MGGLENLLVSVASWFADHAFPTVAGFIGGVVGGEVVYRVRNRKKKNG